MYIGRCKSLDLTEVIPLICISAIGASILQLDFHILSSSFTIGSGGSLWQQLNGCQIGGIALPWFPLGPEIKFGGSE